jgi:prophage regulatory protein
MPEPNKILRIRTVLHRTGLSRSTLYRKMKEGTFPNQVQISEHCCGWHESEIARWIADPEHYGRGVPVSGQSELTQSPQPRRPSP